MTLQAVMHGRDDGGFIMVDALTGVVIAALMIAVCLGTVKASRAMTKSAADMRTAQALMMTLMESAPRHAGDFSGRSSGFSYRIRVTDEKVNRVHLCQIDIVVAAKRHHPYRLSGARWCEDVAA